MVKTRSQLDYIFLGIVAILIVLGGLILVSVSASLSQEKFGSSFYYLNHQILYGFLPGIILAFFAFKINLNILKKWIPLLLLINLVLLIMVFVPRFSLSFRGASRWLNLGPISFQPSEFLKLTFIIYLASWLDSRNKKTNSPKSKKKFSETLIAFLIITGIISLLLIFQPDISTLGIILASSVLMFFLADTPFWHTVLIISNSILL
ncbi:MAG: FtsW/RodA/SpoVE family cell cycle protein, partial [Candidatus Paceibacterales bacterium]